jgi:hypothetical protein
MGLGKMTKSIAQIFAQKRGIALLIRPMFALTFGKGRFWGSMVCGVLVKRQIKAA